MAKALKETTKAVSKKDTIIALLRREQSASVPEMIDATGWQQHSVRGFLAGTIKAKLDLPLVSEMTESGERKYHIAALKLVAK